MFGIESKTLLIIWSWSKSRAACSRINIEVATLMVVPQHQILEGGKIFEAEALIACNEKLLKYGAKSKLVKI